MKEIRLSELENEIKRNDLSFVVFYTTWCGDCKMMTPFLLELEKNNPSVKFFSIDAEKESVFRKENTKYKVLKVPTMILYKKQIEIERGYEFIPYFKLQGWIDNAKKKN